MPLPAIHPLAPPDAEDYQRLRLTGLLESALAFRSSYAEEVGRSVAEVADRLRGAPDGSTCVFGARVDGRLVGVLALTRPRRAKLAHAAELTGMYVALEARRRGIAGELLSTAIAHARDLPGVRYLRLTVNASNAPARALYQSRGFKCVGVEREAIFVGGRYHDEELRILRLVELAAPGVAP